MKRKKPREERQRRREERQAREAATSAAPLRYGGSLGTFLALPDGKVIELSMEDGKPRTPGDVRQR